LFTSIVEWLRDAGVGPGMEGDQCSMRSLEWYLYRKTKAKYGDDNIIVNKTKRGVLFS
jgi:hypothetical protein